VHAGRFGFSAHLYGMLLGSETFGVFLVPFCHSLLTFFLGGSRQALHKLLMTPHEFRATGVKDDCGL
jgi:hypothetical protein